MTNRSSTSDAIGINWLYTRPAFGRTGRGLAENNFAKERRNWLAILLREVLQNGLDARISTDCPVEVRIKSIDLPNDDYSFMEQLLPKSHISRFEHSVLNQKDQKIDLRHCLIIEDFGTSGLIGTTNNPEIDGKGQNWNAFWFREGEGGKEHGSGNGGAGQGKITYFSTSGIRTIFSYTVRKDDGRELLYGASSFKRDYFFEEHKWLRDAYWGIAHQLENGPIAVPSTDEKLIRDFRAKMGITRQAGQSGLSLVIPAANKVLYSEAVKITIAEFFAPIIRGDLIVQLGDTRIDTNSVTELANRLLSDEEARALHTCTTRGYREFYAQALDRSRTGQVEIVEAITSHTAMSESIFPADILSRLRETLDSEQPIAARFPVTIKPKSGQPILCHFDVHLAVPLELEQVEQAVLRRDLLIGEEPIGGGGLRQRARGLTLIDDPELSKLLLCAEEPTHLRWNTRLPRLDEYYKSGPAVIAYVRNAMAKLLDVVIGGEQKRDFRILAKYFAALGSEAPTQAKGKKSEKGKGSIEVNPIPPSQPKKLTLTALLDGCKVSSNKSSPLDVSDLPVTAQIEFAYEGIDKDAFAEYDPLDFVLDDKSFSVEAMGCQVKTRELNRIEFMVTAPEFSLVVGGFDQHLRLRVRLNYQEANDAALIDAE